MIAKIETDQGGSQLYIVIRPCVNTRVDARLYRAVFNADLFKEVEYDCGSQGFARFNFALESDGQIVARAYMGNRTLAHADLQRMGNTVQEYAEKVVAEVVRIEEACKIIAEARKAQ